MSPKHFQLVVPNYDQSSKSQGGAPLTFLRLGAGFDAAETSPPATHRGDDLVKGLTFKDDARDPTIPGKTYTRDDGVKTNPLATRAALTKELLTRGGWRDHTDGNRISTTRGDCVEVVRGNYKMVVLGRVADNWDPSKDDAGNSSSVNPHVGSSRWESSGGHNNEATSTPGEMLSITWAKDDEDGTWKTLEQTDKGDCKGIYKGTVKTEFYGPSITSTIGCGVDALGDAPKHEAHKPDITDKTYAQSITTTEDIGTFEETTTIGFVGTKSETTRVKKSLTTTTTASSLTDTKAYAFFCESVIAMTHHQTLGTGIRVNLSIGAVSLGVTLLAAQYTKRKEGLKLSVFGGLKGAVEGHAFTIKNDNSAQFSLRIGGKTSISLAASLELTLLKCASIANWWKARVAYQDTVAAALKTGASKQDIKAAHSKT